MAGKSTLNRLELSRRRPRSTARSHISPRRSRPCSSTCFSKRTHGLPRQMILDLVATDDPLHGHQEGRFFRGYYDCYCYLPLYVFCGRHLLAAKFRPSNAEDSAGSVEEVAHRRANSQALAANAHPAARQPWVRPRGADGRSTNRVDFVFGLARNAGWSKRSASNSCRPRRRRPRPASPLAASGTSVMRRSTAGRAGAGSSPRRNGQTARPIRASSSPR